MTINDLITELSIASDKLAALTPNDPSRFDLEIAISQIKKELIAESFDVDVDLNKIHAPDLTNFRRYVDDLKAATTAAQVQPGIGGKILGIVKNILPMIAL